jgi:hypothetical protein
MKTSNMKKPVKKSVKAWVVTLYGDIATVAETYFVFTNKIAAEDEAERLHGIVKEVTIAY